MDKNIFLRLPGHSMLALSITDIFTVEDLFDCFDQKDSYILSEGKVLENDTNLVHGKSYTICRRLRGGKGGFGSMLRAIGAQIEKTTNREACRDLSGRRMRDVNNEKKMVEYLEKKAEREREREKKKIEKLERLTQQPKHFFNDPDYDSKLREAVENVDNAVEKGIIAHTKKRKSNPNEKQNEEPKTKKGLWLGEEELSDSDSDDDESMQFQSRLLATSESNNSDSGASSSKQTDTTLPKESDISSKSDSTTELTQNFEVKDMNNIDNEISSNNVVSHPSPEINDENPTGTQAEVQIDDTKTSDAVSNGSDMSIKANDSISKAVEKDKISNLDDIDFTNYSTADELESLGLEILKSALMKKGIKCGGSLKERAARLFVVKDLSPDQIDPSLLATKSKKRNRSKK